MANTCIEFELSSCVSSEWKDGALLIAPDLFGEDPSGRGLDSVQPLGLYARPRDPVDGKGASCLHGFQGDLGFVMPSMDADTIGRVPQGPPGSTVLYSSGEGITAYHYIDGKTGYHQLLVKYGNQSLSITLNTSVTGQESIDIRHGEGHGICLTADKKTVLNSANGQNYIEVSDAGIVMQGPVKMIGGVSAGDVGGVPVALSTELASLLTAINVTLQAGLAVAGVKATLAAPIVVSMPGSSKVSAPT